MTPRRSQSLHQQIFFFSLLTGVITLLVFLIWIFLFARRDITIVLIFGLLLVIVGVHVVLNLYLRKKIIAPIKRLDELAEQLSCNPHQIMERSDTDPPEIDRLIQRLNTLIEQMDVSMTELRNFVTNASHELRTPLTTIKLRVEALRDGALDDREVALKFLNDVESEIDSLTKMVSDLLDLSRIEAGITYSPSSEINLSSLALEVCDAFSVRAERANIKLICSVDEPLPQLIGVEEQLRRLIYNLVDNALKYTSPGGWVEVRVDHVPDSGNVTLCVKDNGFGIPPSYLPHIFERFYRVEATRPRYGQSRGSGLGLAIVKAIADVHKAQIQVDSDVGKGTCFTITFPLSTC